MLAQAGKKCLPSTSLIEANCTSTPLAARSADCVLASFLLSYVQDIDRFAAEAARILRPGGTLIVSDLHPNTPSYGWRRTFRAAGDLFEIATFPYTLPGLIAAMNAAGLAAELIHEPSFGDDDAAVFRANSMLDILPSGGVPARHLLGTVLTRSELTLQTCTTPITFEGARVARSAYNAQYRTLSVRRLAIEMHRMTEVGRRVDSRRRADH